MLIALIKKICTFRNGNEDYVDSKSFDPKQYSIFSWPGGIVKGRINEGGRFAVKGNLRTTGKEEYIANFTRAPYGITIPYGSYTNLHFEAMLGHNFSILPSTINQYGGVCNFLSIAKVRIPPIPANRCYDMQFEHCEGGEC
ncbi:hypothetical protein [Piscirickettsia litoralis]|uniref:Uncharacterized protein n=1 Tax=Piscirickettsia litoralis TaxID=1891921 RepID=A0ABX3A364_9GAMM|nr:hypothetical protein [Piscirickettsia litoralis]ODN43317.1 hypothetical protein BGC07_10775 [Piscirickettsia litoralis]